MDALLIGLLTGCAAPVAVLYTPSSLVTGQGRIQVERFRYLPAEQGKLKPNQIQNTALGSILISDDIGQYVSDAIQSEFKYAGYSIGKGSTVLQGTVEKFLADDLGYDIRWTLIVSFRLVDRSEQKTLLERPVKIKLKSDKFIAPLNAMNKVIRMCFEEWVKDPAVQAILQRW